MQMVICSSFVQISYRMFCNRITGCDVVAKDVRHVNVGHISLLFIVFDYYVKNRKGL